MKKAFTLIEILIVVAILGILAAVVVPQLQGHTAKAKEAAAKDNLRIWRHTIELYAAQHKDYPPGYLGGVVNTSIETIGKQMICTTNENGGSIGGRVPSGNYKFGPYFKELPANPLNDKTTIKILTNAEAFPAAATDTYGWIYKPQTKDIRLDATGTDSAGVAYYDY